MAIAYGWSVSPTREKSVEDDPSKRVEHADENGQMARLLGRREADEMAGSRRVRDAVSNCAERDHDDSHLHQGRQHLPLTVKALPF